MEKAEGLKALQDAIAKIEATIKASDGVFHVLIPVSLLNCSLESLFPTIYIFDV